MSSSPVSSPRQSSLKWATGAVLLAALAPLGGAEDPERSFDVRLGVGTTPSPDISEKVSAAGASTKYEWKGGNTHGFGVDAGARWLCLHDWGGLVGGGDVVVAQSDTTPAYVQRKSDGAAFSTGGLDLHYWTTGVQVAYGYCYATSRDPEELAIYLEVMPFLGAGGAMGETAGQNSSGDIVRRSGFGYYWEYGVRGGIYLTERHFLVGVTMQYAAGSGQVNIDLPGGGTSELTTDREGFGVGVETGWRF